MRWFVAVPVAALLAGCGSERTRPAAPANVVAATAAARNETLPETRVTTGTVRSTNVSPLAAKVMGNVTRVLVTEGQRVRAGDLLLEIDDREMRARREQAVAAANESEQAIAAARANAAVMAATYKRFAMLRDQGTISAQAFDEAAAKNSAAQAQLQQALAQRARSGAGVSEARAFESYTRMRSPISGVVTARMVDPGAQAAPGMPLLTVEDDAHYRVETTIDEELASRVHAGGAVTINDSIAATITNVVPAFDPVTRSALVKIELPRNAGLTSGAFVRVAFPIGTRSGITIPASAVQRRGQLTSVSIVAAGGAPQMRLVTLGETLGQRVEVLSGLDAGEKVALR